jgi:hypothetical protein
LTERVGVRSVDVERAVDRVRVGPGSGSTNGPVIARMEATVIIIVTTTTGPMADPVARAAITSEARVRAVPIPRRSRGGPTGRDCRPGAPA